MEQKDSLEASKVREDVSWVLLEHSNKKDINKVYNFMEAENAVDAPQLWEFPKEFNFKWYDFILYKDVFSPIYAFERWYLVRKSL